GAPQPGQVALLELPGPEARRPGLGIARRAGALRAPRRAAVQDEPLDLHLQAIGDLLPAAREDLDAGPGLARVAADHDARGTARGGRQGDGERAPEARDRLRVERELARDAAD